MASRFEDMIAWQKARVLAHSVYEATRGSRLSRDFALARQMQRAAVSVMSNIAEGFERRGAAEFRRFLIIAKGSCAEVRSQLYLALDVGYIDGKRFNVLQKQAVEVARIISALRNSIHKDNDGS